MALSVHVLAFAGSLRIHSYNRAVLRAAAELAPDGLQLEPYDLRPIPLYDGDVEAVGWPEPVAMLGASAGGFGTVRAQAHLRQICVGLGMLPLGKPDVLIANARDRFDGEGRLVDETTRQGIRALLDALLVWVRRLRGA